MHAKLTLPAAGRQRRGGEPRALEELDAAVTTIRFAPAAATLTPAGMLWVAWPKKASKVPTDLIENRVRTHGLAGGLVDVKVCAVDEVWSGLKFVRRLGDR